MSGFDERIEKLRELILSHQLEAIVLRRNPNLAWLTGGRVHVPTTIDASCLDLVVTTSTEYVITNTIEAPRLVAEELPEGIEVRTVPWWEGRDSLLPSGEKVGSDLPGAGRRDIGVEIEQLRQSLIQSDVDRFAQVCTDAAISLGDALRTITRGDREVDVAGRITNALWGRDLEISFLGVAGERRAPLMRHPLPTVENVGDRVVASICAKRKGLIASVTRIVHFGPVGNSYSYYESLLRVEARILDATVVGAAFSEPVEAAARAYGENGFDSLEWHKHHQGGPTGYLPRDWPANLNSMQRIANHQPIGWNPTGEGWKVEDTLITDGEGISILTYDPNWPSVIVSGRSRPDILVL